MPWLLPKICIIIQNSHVKLVQKYSLLFQFSATIQDKDGHQGDKEPFMNGVQMTCTGACKEKK